MSMKTNWLDAELAHELAQLAQDSCLKAVFCASAPVASVPSLEGTDWSTGATETALPPIYPSPCRIGSPLVLHTHPFLMLLASRPLPSHAPIEPPGQLHRWETPAPIPETDLLVEMPVVAGQPGAQHRAYAPPAYGQKTETET